MPRPRLKRRITHNPNIKYFKPAGIPIKELEEVILTKEEVESMRLKNIEKLDQDKCAEKMNISQPTFHRILLTARQKVSDAIVNGKAIRLEDD